MPPTKRKSPTRTKILAIDTETTGLDHHHGCRPFLVTTCTDLGEVVFWEWKVDPLTRLVDVPTEDVEQIRKMIDDAEEIVLHNGKFDVAMLGTVIPDLVWPWYKTHDTLVAAHLLNSASPKDLTSLAISWLGADIRPYEKALEAAVKKGRSIVQRARGRERTKARKSAKANLFQENQPEEIATWRIGSSDDPMIPSSSDETWQCDFWLPKALYDDPLQESDDDWRTVLAEYANKDSEATVLIWGLMRKELERRNLWKIYVERMRLPEIVVGMESRGIGINRRRLDELRSKYREESEKAGKKCLEIAKKNYGFDLALPKGASPNDSLRDFIYHSMELEPRYAKKSKTGNPSLDKDAFQYYLDTLPQGSVELDFIETLSNKRKRDTYSSYMDSYKRFWIHFDGDDYIVFPSLNMTGTKTLRWSSENPNEQSISKRGLFEGDIYTLRYNFGPRPGRFYWSCDAKNIELRIPGYESKEPELIALFERPNDPPYYGSEHLLNFHTVYPDVWEEELKLVGFDRVGPSLKKKYESSWYKYVKNGGFALGYGAGIQTTDRAFRRPGSFNRLKERFSQKEKLNQHYIKMANQLGYVETIPDRSIDPERGYPVALPRDEYGRIKPTLPLNYHVQSTAMQWTNRAMVRVNDFFGYLNGGGIFRKQRWSGGYYIAIQQHDELVFDTPAIVRPGREPWSYSRPVIEEARRLMAMGGDDIGIPTPVGLEFHERNWSECVTLA